ncbi:hypothetical protein Slin15195_G107480 [Septoria linicola]|uniref:F-box domain-containing protein n=1 Tax=Septoria linicola TaxID=215465 RepID=A0A9Q9AYF8_9PEZI|nr:hypothetical protein Slin15195_G107480 [Septoria linicola]
MDDKARPKTRLLSLPAEIRQQIYELVLFQHSGLSRSQVTNRLYTWIDIRRFRNGKPESLTYTSPPILSTCRLIRWEASPLYYTKIQFRFMEGQAAVRWLSCLEADNRCDLKDLAYCPNYLTWMDPRNPPLRAEILGKDWSDLCDAFRKLNVDGSAVLRVCGYGGGQVGWIFAKSFDFDAADADGLAEAAVQI